MVLSACCCLEILQSCPDYPGREGGSDLDLAAFEELEEPFCVFFFLIRSFFKDICNLDIPLHAGLACKIIIPVACLRLPGKRGEKILFGSRAL